jgi:hypothetical protein
MADSDIIQIIPANGKILGMDPDSAGWMEPANETTNFTGFVHEDDHTTGETTP